MPCLSGALCSARDAPLSFCSRRGKHHDPVATPRMAMVHHGLQRVEGVHPRSSCCASLFSASMGDLSRSVKIDTGDGWIERYNHVR